MEKDPYYVIAGEFVSDAAAKTVEAKRLLRSGRVHTATDAAKAVGISRGVFYKYKDKVHPFYDKGIDREVTLYATLSDKAGVLSSFLGIFAGAGANILTMTQTMPVEGVASISVTAQIAELEMPLGEMLEKLKNNDGVIGLDFVTGD